MKVEILVPKESTKQRTCSCLNNVHCPSEEKSLTTNIVYKAKVTSSNQNHHENVYFSFKKRFPNHKKSFNLNEYKNETELSNEI